MKHSTFSLSMGKMIGKDIVLIAAISVNVQLLTNNLKPNDCQLVTDGVVV